MLINDEAGMPKVQWLIRIEKKGVLYISKETLKDINPFRFEGFLSKNNLKSRNFGKDLVEVTKDNLL